MAPADPGAAAALTRAESLACIPLRNPAVHAEQRPPGHALLHYPGRAEPWPLRWIARLGRHRSQTACWRKLQLDQLGTAVWELIDGSRSVAEIARLFAARYQLHPREAELSVARFLKELGRRGVIGMRAD